ncbi:unnamed protein product [Symbiodinium natans]|uniref:Uncharacterized protein n=1 Tax=Symbiodinium natans TaxID=878477 RepID=A0A812SU68_9DINO|nr:unnamed protein product [Symbiodinium natans]
MALDPVARKRSAFSKALRRLLAKFAAFDGDSAAASWAMFKGVINQPVTAEEKRYRAHIEDLTMRDADAQRIMETLDYSTPWYLRVEWVKALAALANVYRDDMHRIAPVRIVASDSSCIRQRRQKEPSGISITFAFGTICLRKKLMLFPVGTTSNESLHSEVNRWFRETQKLHKATLDLKLQMLTLGKLLSHKSALYHPGTRQMTHGEVLARSTKQVVWSDADWKSWCSELDQSASAKRKAELPVEQERCAQRRKVRAASVKRPAAAAKNAAKSHRAPRTLQRQDKLVRDGKKKHAFLNCPVSLRRKVILRILPSKT